VNSKKFSLLAFLGVLGGLAFWLTTAQGQNYLQNWQIVQDAALPINDHAERTDNETIISSFDKSFNIPLRLSATSPTPDAVLNIESNQVEMGNESLKSTSPIDDQINVFSATTINFQTGATTGGTVTVEGAAWALPSCTVGQYRRMVIKYQSADNALDTKFSPEAATLGLIENPGTTFAGIDGSPVGYINLECTNVAGQYKTPASATDIIENKVGSDNHVFNFGSGSGGGSGEVADFKLQSVAANGLTVIKGGRYYIADGKVIATYDGAGTDSTDFEVDLTIDLDNVISSPTDDTTYYLYVDLNSLDLTPTTLTDDGRKLYPVEEANFSLFTQHPEELTQPSRYVYIGVVRRATGAWSTTVKVTSPIKVSPIPSVMSVPIEYTLDYTAVGSVGSADQIKAGHPLSSGSFPSGADTSWYGLTDVNDGNTTNAHNLTNNGTTVFTSSGILGVTNSAMVLNGTDQYLSSTDAHFNPGDTDHTFSGWFKNDNWATATGEALLSNWDSSGAQRSFLLEITPSGTLEVRASTDGAVSTATDVLSASELDALTGWNHFACVYTASDNTYKFYLNSVYVTSHVAAGNLHTSTTPEFNIGAFNNGNDPWDGDVDEVFFVNGTALTDNDIAKVYASAIYHNTGIAPNSQSWNILGRNSGIDRPVSGRIVDKDSNVLYVDFSSEETATEVQLQMFDTRTNRRVTAVQGVRKEDTAANVDASLPITHGLGTTPTAIAFWVKSGSVYEYHDPGTYFDISSTQIVSTGTTLTSVLGGATEVILVVSTGVSAVATQAEVWNTYVATGANTLSDGDAVFCDTTANQSLPLNARLGAVIRLSDYDGDWNTNNCTVDRNGYTINGAASNLVLDLDNDSVELKYNGNNDWRILF